MTIKEKLELLALAVQIISFPIAAWSLYWARREAKASRDLQIALNVWDSFQKHWEGGWSNAFYAVQEAQQLSGSSEIPTEHRDTFFQMLNWIDWLGTLIRTESLSETEIIFGSIGPQFADMIDMGEPLLEPYFQKYGRPYWKGLLRVAKEIKAKEIPMKFVVYDDD
jgi:hypothetical protein